MFHALVQHDRLTVSGKGRGKRKLSQTSLPRRRLLRRRSIRIGPVATSPKARTTSDGARKSWFTRLAARTRRVR